MIDDNADHTGPSLLCTGSQGAAWLSTTGLPLDPDGRIRTDHDQESRQAIPVASGDCADQRLTRLASGVGRCARTPLANNLEAACQGPLGTWYPQQQHCS